MEQKLITLRTRDEVLDLAESLVDKQLITLDTETNGVHIGCQIIGASLCADSETAYYIITAVWDKEKQQLVVDKDVSEALQMLLATLSGKQLVLHNAIFDCRVIEDAYKLRLIDSVYADTMIMAHLVDEEGPKALKDLGTMYFGSSSTAEQADMKASVLANGGVWSDAKGGNKDMYKADPELLAKYGAKDALLTFNLFYVLCEKLIDEDLTDFFFNAESMPLLRGPTYDLNTTGLRVDVVKLKKIELEMEHEIERLKLSLVDDIAPYIKDRPNFSITAPQQLSWLLFIKLNLPFRSLNDTGRALAKDLIGKLPYTDSERRKFIAAVTAERKKLEHRLADSEPEYKQRISDLKTQLKAVKKLNKTSPDATTELNIKELGVKIKSAEDYLKRLNSEINRLQPEKYIQADKAVLKDLAPRVDWIAKLLKLKSEEKLLGTYVKGIQSKLHYGIIHPRFNQTGTPSGRYSSSDPNFQNLPRDDKRVKSCIIARPGRVFVGADQDQLEARVFAALSGDDELIGAFKRGDDLYSVVGMKIFNKTDCVPKKEGSPEAFGIKYKALRNIAKQVCLASAYGTTAAKQAQVLRDENGKSLDINRCQKIIDDYFQLFPGVLKMMLDAHNEVKTKGLVRSIYGRPRRLPEGLIIGKRYPNIPHKELKYEDRSILNLAMNFYCQSGAGSIINRAGIAFDQKAKELNIQFKQVLNVHDEIVIECSEQDAPVVAVLLKDAMEKTCKLPNGVALIANPVIANNLADLK